MDPNNFFSDMHYFVEYPLITKNKITDTIFIIYGLFRVKLWSYFFVNELYE